MPQDLNRVPAGLLDLLQIKSVGQNVRLLNDQASLILEMLPFYATAIGLRIAEEFESNVNFALNLNTSKAVVNVPSDEIWMVKNVTSTIVTTTAGAGDKASFDTVIQRIQATENIVLATSPPLGFGVTAGVVDATVSGHANFETPFFAPPGSQIVTTPRNFTGGVAVYTVGTRVAYYPLAV